jgi:hypothetical protein
LAVQQELAVLVAGWLVWHLMEGGGLELLVQQQQQVAVVVVVG